MRAVHAIVIAATKAAGGRVPGDEATPVIDAPNALACYPAGSIAMTPDGLTPDAAARDSLRPDRRSWRRDVIEGVTRRFAFAALPALMLALVARTLRREWDMVARAGGDAGRASR